MLLKRLRYYVRFLVVGLLLNEFEVVRDLVKVGGLIILIIFLSLNLGNFRMVRIRGIGHLSDFNRKVPSKVQIYNFENICTKIYHLNCLFVNKHTKLYQLNCF